MAPPESDKNPEGSSMSRNSIISEVPVTVHCSLLRPKYETLTENCRNFNSDLTEIRAKNIKLENGITSNETCDYVDSGDDPSTSENAPAPPVLQNGQSDESEVKPEVSSSVAIKLEVDEDEPMEVPVEDLLILLELPRSDASENGNVDGNVQKNDHNLSTEANSSTPTENYQAEVQQSLPQQSQSSPVESLQYYVGPFQFHDQVVVAETHGEVMEYLGSLCCQERNNSPDSNGTEAMDTQTSVPVLPTPDTSANPVPETNAPVCNWNGVPEQFDDDVLMSRRRGRRTKVKPQDAQDNEMDIAGEAPNPESNDNLSAQNGAVLDETNTQAVPTLVLAPIGEDMVISPAPATENADKPIENGLNGEPMEVEVGNGERKKKTRRKNGKGKKGRLSKAMNSSTDGESSNQSGATIPEGTAAEKAPTEEIGGEVRQRPRRKAAIKGVENLYIFLGKHKETKESVANGDYLSSLVSFLNSSDSDESDDDAVEIVDPNDFEFKPGRKGKAASGGRGRRRGRNSRRSTKVNGSDVDSPSPPKTSRGGNGGRRGRKKLGAANQSGQPENMHIN